MRTVLARAAAMTSVLLMVVGCSGLFKKGGGEDAGAEAATAEAPQADAEAAPVPATVALATNEGDVARFPDETKLADVAAVTKRAFNVREAPPAGAVIMNLPGGSATTQIASRGPYFLVTFDSGGGRKMGWIHRDAYSAIVPDAGVLTCPAGEVAIVGDTPFCGKLCSADTECPSGQACKGSGAKLMPNGKPGDSVTVCTFFQDPNQRKVKGLKPVDAGTPTPPPVVDAGAAPTPAPAQDVVAPTGGACPGNFVLVKKTGKCHRPCTSVTAGECKNKPFFCIKCDNDTKKVCGDSRDQCK